MFWKRHDPAPAMITRVAELEARCDSLRRSLTDLDDRIEGWMKRESKRAQGGQTPAAPVPLNIRDVVAERRARRAAARGDDAASG